MIIGSTRDVDATKNRVRVYRFTLHYVLVDDYLANHLPSSTNLYFVCFVINLDN